MTKPQTHETILKLATHIDGFDLISDGGLPVGRTTLVSGTAGSAKTVMACQYLVTGIAHGDQNGVFVTFEESPDDIRKNMSAFGWDISALEAEGKWAFVDASPRPDLEPVETGEYDFGALIARIEHAIRAIDAKRLSMDSLGAIFNQFEESRIVRRELFRIASALKQIGVTAILTAERAEEYGGIARMGVEEFVTDNVIILRNILEDENRRRTIEILKFRGTNHQKGEFPFSIMPDHGVVVIPLSSIELKQKSSRVRISSGVPELDNMCSGGFFRDSIILISGATGTGKTLTSTHFIAGIKEEHERSLLFAFEESKEQLFRNAEGWGVDFEKMVKEGRLKVDCAYPETMGLEDHLIRMKEVINQFKPTRIAVDSLSALERISSAKGFRQFVISMTSFIKHQEMSGFFTSTTPTLMGGESVTEAHISTITDSIILLRYVEAMGEMRRGITILKMRGTGHEKEIREFSIDQKGMHIGKPFRNISGIISGHPVQLASGEIERMDSLFGTGQE